MDVDYFRIPPCHATIPPKRLVSSLWTKDTFPGRSLRGRGAQYPKLKEPEMKVDWFYWKTKFTYVHRRGIERRRPPATSDLTDLQWTPMVISQQNRGKILNLRCYVWKNTTFLVPCKPFSRTWDFGRRWAFSSKRPSFHFSDLSQTWMSV